MEIDNIQNRPLTRFALFCDRAYSLTAVAMVVPMHVPATIVEVEDERVVAVEAAVVRRGTPTVAI